MKVMKRNLRHLQRPSMDAGSADQAYEAEAAARKVEAQRWINQW